MRALSRQYSICILILHLISISCTLAESHVTKFDFDPHGLDGEAHLVARGVKEFEELASLQFVTAPAEIITAAHISPSIERKGTTNYLILGTQDGSLLIHSLRGYRVGQLDSPPRESRAVTALTSYRRQRNETVLLVGYASGALEAVVFGEWIDEHGNGVADPFRRAVHMPSRRPFASIPVSAFESSFDEPLQGMQNNDEGGGISFLHVRKRGPQSPALIVGVVTQPCSAAGQEETCRSKSRQLVALWRDDGSIQATRLLPANARVLDVRLGDHYVSVLTSQGMSILELPSLTWRPMLVPCSGQNDKDDDWVAGAFDLASERRAVVMDAAGVVHYLLLGGSRSVKSCRSLSSLPLVTPRSSLAFPSQPSLASIHMLRGTVLVQRGSDLIVLDASQLSPTRLTSIPPRDASLRHVLSQRMDTIVAPLHQQLPPSTTPRVVTTHLDGMTLLSLASRSYSLFDLSLAHPTASSPVVMDPSGSSPLGAGLLASLPAIGMICMIGFMMMNVQRNVQGRRDERLHDWSGGGFMMGNAAVRGPMRVMEEEEEEQVINQVDFRPAELRKMMQMAHSPDLSEEPPRAVEAMKRIAAEVQASVWPTTSDAALQNPYDTPPIPPSLLMRRDSRRPKSTDPSTPPTQSLSRRDSPTVREDNDRRAAEEAFASFFRPSGGADSLPSIRNSNGQGDMMTPLGGTEQQVSMAHVRDNADFLNLLALIQQELAPDSERLLAVMESLRTLCTEVETVESLRDVYRNLEALLGDEQVDLLAELASFLPVSAIPQQFNTNLDDEEEEEENDGKSSQVQARFGPVGSALLPRATTKSLPLHMAFAPPHPNDKDPVVVVTENLNDVEQFLL